MLEVRYQAWHKIKVHYIIDILVNNVTTQEGMIAFAELGGKIYLENLVYQNSIQTGAR